MEGRCRVRTLVIAASLLALTAPAAIAQQAGSPAGAAVSGETAPGRYLVFFELDRATLTADARTAIAEAVKEYQETGAVRIALAGHADRSASEAYNQRLSERRVEAVRRELVRLGVPNANISATALGETSPLVPTADGVREPRNRRVEIVLSQPSTPPAEAPATARAEEPAREARAAPRFTLAVGGLLGHNHRETDDGSESHLAGGDITFGFAPVGPVSLRLNQALLYSFHADDDGIGGRSVAGLDLQVPYLPFSPYLGANVGGVYGEGFQQGFIVGPELGFKIGLGETMFLNAKASYDYQFRNPDWDDGITLLGVGLGWRF